MMDHDFKNRISENALRIVFAASVFAAGSYYELCSALISIALLSLLLFGKRPLAFRPSLPIISALLISLFYFLSSLWAVDRAMALWGGVKYLPVLLWAVCFSVMGSDARRAVISDLPILGAVNTVLSFALLFIPAFTATFVIGGRLGGFFFYPNTFACFLLLGIQVLLFSAERNYGRMKYPLLAVLCFGLFLSGSRAVLALAAVTLPLGAIHRSRKEGFSHKPLLICLAAIAAGAVLGLAAARLPGLRSAQHVASGGGSTLYGRLLYWKDAALPIRKHPFGIGYLGYFMTQTSFQTGIYNVRWAHNELIQLLLDVGWIPAAVMTAAILKSLLSQKHSFCAKLLLLTLCAHSLFDFNFEFLAMYGLLFALLEYEQKKEYRLPRPAMLIPGILLCLFSLYVGAASSLTYAGNNESAAKLYKGNTLAENQLITQITDRSELEALADRILSRNEHVSSAWDAKALCSYAAGDFSEFIKAKEKAIAENPYYLPHYEDYFRRLAIGVELYTKAGDTSSAGFCLERIYKINDMLDELRAKTSDLAYKTIDKPSFAISADYDSYLAEHPRNR